MYHHTHDRRLWAFTRLADEAPLAQSDSLGRSSKRLPPSSKLYDDPAFSPDPLAHPFFAKSHDPWKFPSGMNPLPPLAIPSSTTDAHAPGGVDDNTTTISHESTSSTSTSSHSTVPTSHDSHSFSSTPQIPAITDTKPSSSPSEKKKNSMTLFWRKIHPETKVVSEAHHQLTIHLAGPPPAYEAVPSNKTTVAAEMQTPSDSLAPARLETTAATDLKPPPTAAARHIIGGVAINAHELDRIDELDESNPMGLPVHHGGPYEAVLKAFMPESTEEKKQALHNIGSQYEYPPASRSSIQDRPSNSHRPQRSKAPIPYVPPGMSLNLTPGQILPYEFQFQQAHPGRPSQFSGHEYQSRRYSESQKGYRPADNPNLYNNNMSLDRAASEHDRRLGIPQPAPTISKPFTDNTQMIQPILEESTYTMGLPNLIPPVHSLGVQVPLSDRPPSTVHRPNHNNPRLPPRMQALRRDQAKAAGRSMDEQQRHSSQAFETWENGRSKQDLPRYTRSMVVGPSTGRSTSHPSQTPVFELDQAPHFDLDHRGPEPPSIARAGIIATHISVPNRLQNENGSGQPRSRDQDGRSLQQTVTDNSTLSASSGNTRKPPRPHHVPKRLVMPAPLQGSQPVPPRHRSHPPPPRYANSNGGPPRHRPPSPPTVLPSTFTDGLSRRAQEIPVFVPQNNKLRKRGSVQGLPMPALPFSSTTPLSFEPVIDYRSVTKAPPQSNISHPNPRKVLSKRRTDL